jgi:DNA primase
MAHIPDEVIAEIRERADIVAMIGEHVQLKKAGASHKGLCPFHQEKTPSFHVNPARKTFYCFGCQKKGDVFAFLMELQGKSFVEVLRELAQRTGVIIPERSVSPEAAARKSERSRLLDLNGSACAFYQGILHDARGAAGRAYLAARGIDVDGAVTTTFRLGMAPDAWDGLAHHLEGIHASQQDALLLGLIAPRTSGRGHYDKFRNRLMCPVILPGGEVAGFSGRTLGADPETPKYVNSPESPVYKKSQLLFGLHAARPAWARKGRAILVEGNFDVISLHQAGFTETVAPLGTALTAEQVDILRRLAPMVILCLDGDKAGRAAALRAVPLLAGAVDARVARLPDGEDPDSFVRKRGAAALEELVARAQPAVDYFLDELWWRTDQSADRRAAAIRQAAPLIVAIADDVKREIVVGQFATALSVSPHVVRRALREVPAEATAAPAPAPTSPPPPTVELNVIALLDEHPDLWEMAEELGIGSLLTDARLRDMYLGRRAGKSFLDEAPAEIANLVAVKLHAGSFARVESPRRALHDAWRVLQGAKLQTEDERLGRELKEALRRGNAALARELSLKRLQTRNMAEALKRRPEDERR